MRFTTINRKQFAVLWAFAGYTDGGDPQVSSPVEIRLRHEMGAGGENIGPETTPISDRRTGYVDRAIPVGSILWLGRLRDVPVPPTTLFEVIDPTDTVSINAKSTEHTVVLQKYSNTLPTLV